MVRDKEVMIDSDLAELYQVSTKVLNQAIRRNLKRFPADFMFNLNENEFKNLRSQFVTSSWRSQFATSNYGGRRYRPYVFTEHGVAMLSSVLNSKRAIQMNILIIRAFIQLRHMLAEHKEFAKRLQKVESMQKFHNEVLNGLVRDVKLSKNPPKTNAIGFEWRTKKIN